MPPPLNLNVMGVAMLRKTAAFLLIPFTMFYLIHIPYEVNKYIKYGHAELKNPIAVFLQFLTSLAMIFPFSILMLAAYFLGFSIYAKLVCKLKINKLHQLTILGLAIGSLGYLPFLLLPGSVSNWPWSIFYCTLYSALYWLFLLSPLKSEHP